jgi:hypothetical protein
MGPKKLVAGKNPALPKRAVFVPRKNTPKDIRDAQEILLQGDPNFVWRQQRWANFKLFCVLNRFHPLADFFRAIPTYTAQHRSHGTSPTSIKTYLKVIRRVFDECTRPSHIFDNLMRSLNRQAAALAPRHAKDFDEKTLMAIVKSMHANGDLVASYVAFFCMTTGFRFADMSHMRFSWICWQTVQPDMVVLEVHITKTIKNPANFTHLRIPAAWIPEIGAAFLSNFRTWLRTSDPQETITGELDLVEYNATIKFHSPTGGGTSYSFRRNFMHRLLSRFTKNGKPEYKKCLEFSLHADEKMLKSAYERRASEVQQAADAAQGNQEEAEEDDDDEDEEDEED